MNAVAVPGGDVIAWFGPAFAQLHPLLQALHRNGGTLRGEVELGYGRGLGAALGRRLALKLGLPKAPGIHGFQVRISHRDGALYWEREFADGGRMVSVFRPVGCWPRGYWEESTGPLRLRLGVEVKEGGWCWRPRRALLGRLPVPLWLLPRSRAYKRIEDGRYRFYVGFTLPLLGTVLSYSGALHAAPEATCA